MNTADTLKGCLSEVNLGMGGTKEVLNGSEALAQVSKGEYKRSFQSWTSKMFLFGNFYTFTKVNCCVTPAQVVHKPTLVPSA